MATKSDTHNTQNSTHKSQPPPSPLPPRAFMSKPRQRLLLVQVVPKRNRCASRSATHWLSLLPRPRNGLLLPNHVLAPVAVVARQVLDVEALPFPRLGVLDGVRHLHVQLLQGLPQICHSDKPCDRRRRPGHISGDGPLPRNGNARNPCRLQ